MMTTSLFHFPMVRVFKRDWCEHFDSLFFSHSYYDRWAEHEGKICSLHFFLISFCCHSRWASGLLFHPGPPLCNLCWACEEPRTLSGGDMVLEQLSKPFMVGLSATRWWSLRPVAILGAAAVSLLLWWSSAACSHCQLYCTRTHSFF